MALRSGYICLRPAVKSQFVYAVAVQLVSCIFPIIFTQSNPCEWKRKTLLSLCKIVWKGSTGPWEFPLPSSFPRINSSQWDNDCLLFQALILGKADPKLSISRKVYELIYELNNICPRILLTVLPQLEFKLKSTEESERLGSVSLLARMFSEKGSSLAQKHR